MPGEKATVVTKDKKTWINKHLNVQQRTDKYFDVWNPTTGKAADRFKETISALSSILSDCIKDEQTLRAIGGGWSLSRAMVTNGRLINTKPLNNILSLSSNNVSSSYAGDSKNLFYVQCGASVQEVNRYLKDKGYSLKTTGASNGQTIAGAVSTGTHGSALNFGSMQDFVVGIHLIIDKNKHIILERETYPVVLPSLANQLGAELIKDDKLFNAALISFGSFGLIHGLIIEAEPLFLLEFHRRKVPINNDLKDAMTTLDFSKLNLPGGLDPYHFEVVFNLHDLKAGANVTTIYKKPYRQNYTPAPMVLDKFGVGDDMLSVVGTLSDAIPELVPTLVNTLVDTFYKTPMDELGTLGEIFRATDVRGKGTSTEMGIDQKNAADTFERILSVHDTKGPYGGIVAYRYVKKSDATLAFTCFDKTATIEMQGVYSDRTQKFFEGVWNEFDNAGINFTFHWGQVNNLTAARVRNKWGDDRVDQWLEARQTLLSEKVRTVFNSPFMKQVGLNN